jgi:hypothetical protein
VRRLLTVIPLAIVAAALVISYVSYEPDSGVDVEVYARDCARCPLRPLEADVELRDGGGAREADGRSGDDGRLRLRVEPGRYTVRAAGRSVPVAVREEQFARVSVRVRTRSGGVSAPEQR